MFIHVYRKIRKKRPLQIQAPQIGNARNPPLNRPSNISPPGGACTWKIAHKYKLKQSKNGTFTSNYKASPIDFETQISFRRQAAPNISPSKRAFKKYKPRGLFSEFDGNPFASIREP